MKQSRTKALQTPSTPSFRRRVYTHYRRQGRTTLPWRTNTEPYRVLVSELMLQQTQVLRVIPKYRSFLKRFPTLRSLAKANLSDVLREWQGLGYNRRAKHLHELAKELIRRGGAFPHAESELKELPGIGPYTAAALMAFSFNTPAVLIETNIRTVYTHVFFPDQQKVSDDELLPLIEKTMDRKHPREWYSALMDYGAYLKGSGVRINAKNRHYVKQSKFEGSRRQLRGELINALIGGPQTMRTLTGRWRSFEVKEQLLQLIKEGLISKRQKSFFLAK